MNSKEVLQSIRAALGFDSEVAEFESALLKDGTEIRYDGELAVGTPIMVVTAEGELPAPDATHELEDGTLVTTQSGEVTEIVNPTLVEDPIVEMEDATDIVEEAVSDSSVVDQITSVIQQVAPDVLTPEIASQVAVEAISTLVDILDANEPAPIMEVMRKVKEMRKMEYTQKPIESVPENNDMQNDIDALKDGMRKMISIMEGFSEMSTHEPLKAPHTSSKKQTQEDQLMKFASALNNLKK